MPFVRQRQDVACQIKQAIAIPQSDFTNLLSFRETVEVKAAVKEVRAGSRAQMRRWLKSRSFKNCSTLTLLALFAVCFHGANAQAKSSKSRSSKSSRAGKSKVSTAAPGGVHAWTSGSMTYIRIRPSTDVPAVAKVPRHTKLFVWGKYNGWYRVETPDHTFGWIHNELVNSPALAKVREMSHSSAKSASDRTGSQTMYGSVETLKSYYRRYGASGAQKGLLAMGVSVGPTKSQRLAAQKAAQAKLAQQKAAQQKEEQAKLAQQKAAQAKFAEQKAAKAKAFQAKLAAARAAQAKAAQAKAAQAKAAQAKATTKPVVIAKPIAAPTVSGTPLQPVLPSPTVQSRVEPRVQSAPKAATPAPPLTPAIPLPPVQAPQTASKSNSGTNGNYRPPKISPQDLMRARDEHLKRRSKIEQEKAKTSKTAFAPANSLAPHVYYMSSAVYSPAMAHPHNGSNAGFMLASYTRNSLPSAQFAPRKELEGPKSLTLPIENARPESQKTADETKETPKGAKTAAPVVLAKNTKAKAPAKTSKPAALAVAKTTAKPVAKATAKAAPGAGAPSRGGSPRDLARLASNSFGQGVVNQALSYRGRPYIRGAASPSRGFDCSGLVYYLLRQRGYNPPRTAAGLARYGKPVPMGQLQAGDLVLFANTYKRGVSHVGIYMGENKFVHAATSGTGVRVDSLGSAYYARKYYGARRVEVKK